MVVRYSLVVVRGCSADHDGAFQSGDGKGVIMAVRIISELLR